MNLPKLPKLPIKKPKASSKGSSSGFQPPRFVSDLLKDMRDRRLVIPAVALLVAIVAVPLVLSASPEPAVPAAPLAPDPQAAAVEPGVLVTQEAGVRDYRKRLDALDRKNPFGDRFDAKAELGGDASESQLVAPEEPVETGGSPVAPEVSLPDSSSSASVEPGQAAPPAPDTQSEPFVLASRVDVEVGIVDRDRRRTLSNVKGGDLLPSKDTPVAMYLGNSDDASTADFLVSRDVSRVNGDGRCKPGKDKCEFLRLEDGDSAYLRFDDGNRYVIKVKDIYFERVPPSKADDS
jgi:hypothetical protein